ADIFVGGPGMNRLISFLFAGLFLLCAITHADVPAACYQLYGSTSTTSGVSSTLYTINTATAVATAIGQIGFAQVSGIAFDPTGRLYGVGIRLNDNVQVTILIDPLTGAGTEVNPTGFDTNVGDDLSFDTNGQLFLYGQDVLALPGHSDF